MIEASQMEKPRRKMKKINISTLSVKPMAGHWGQMKRLFLWKRSPVLLRRNWPTYIKGGREEEREEPGVEGCSGWPEGGSGIQPHPGLCWTWPLTFPGSSPTSTTTSQPIIKVWMSFFPWRSDLMARNSTSCWWPSCVIIEHGSGDRLIRGILDDRSI